MVTSRKDRVNSAPSGVFAPRRGAIPGHHFLGRHPPRGLSLRLRWRQRGRPGRSVRALL